MLMDEKFLGRSAEADYAKHLQTTWYKNNQALRCHRPWRNTSSVDWQLPPSYQRTISCEERVWSIPCRIADDRIVFGCWDNSLQCVRLSDGASLWRFTTQGPVYSSPAVSEDGSFVVGCEDYVLRRISREGQCLWTFEAQGAFHASATIDCAKNIVYAGSYDHTLYALDLATGTLLWKRSFDEQVEDDLYSSPALNADGNIIVGTDNILMCLSPTGEERWRITETSRFEGTAAIDYPSGRGIIGTEIDGKIIVFDTRNGEVLKQFTTDGFVVSCPSLSPQGVAYVGSNDGYVHGIDLQTLEVLWRVNLKCEFRYTPFTVLPSGDALFVGTDERLHCLAQHTGETLWCLEHRGGFHSSPLLTDDGHLVIGSHRNAVHFYQWVP
ncbi:PQQ-binding-like beta-propeller repeat protein [Pseudomonas sp. CFBP 13711]|uniref:outer membrane protein assembly factor BamB family protein n=1 Tax=unclassified Pseudomonas TaxID=196821 RepID=UPI001786B344|nr:MULTISPECIES: PQQ-binding-like beta-propeller repeat protein [unclassified Pseudomonas]MBD8706064.1 PQQ-binding-like beta-propeller repeat protein [Pseudomonas sp. CFBP 13711]MBD8711962.1 PQQ-binding-like beta-propeller repeat protein [Pseudomonas sp. CFBP 13715]